MKEEEEEADEEKVEEESSCSYSKLGLKPDKMNIELSMILQYGKEITGKKCQLGSEERELSSPYIITLQHKCVQSTHNTHICAPHLAPSREIGRKVILVHQQQYSPSGNKSTVCLWVEQLGLELWRSWKFMLVGVGDEANEKRERRID